MKEKEIFVFLGERRGVRGGLRGRLVKLREQPPTLTIETPSCGLRTWVCF